MSDNTYLAPSQRTTMPERPRHTRRMFSYKKGLLGREGSQDSYSRHILNFVRRDRPSVRFANEAELGLQVMGYEFPLILPLLFGTSDRPTFGMAPATDGIVARLTQATLNASMLNRTPDTQ